jgi:hypothetical protein
LIYANYDFSGCRNGTRSVYRRVGNDFNLGFGAGEFLDKTNEWQLAGCNVVVAGNSAGQFAVGNDYKRWLQSGGHPVIYRNRFSPNAARAFRHYHVTHEQL